LSKIMGPSPYETGLAQYEAIMATNNFRQKEALLMILTHMANMRPGPHCQRMAESIGAYFVTTMTGEAK
jgi:hypothetical protein